MKKKIWLSVFGLLIMSLSLSSCFWNWEPVYTVYVADGDYNDQKFLNAYGSMCPDGNYMTVEIDNFNAEVSTYPSEARRYLTEREIREVFLGFGYDSQKATQATRWLLSYERSHALVVNRTGSVAHFVLR